jgi:hypothetical protein
VFLCGGGGLIAPDAGYVFGIVDVPGLFAQEVAVEGGGKMSVVSRRWVVFFFGAPFWSDWERRRREGERAYRGMADCPDLPNKQSPLGLKKSCSLFQRV